MPNRFGHLWEALRVLRGLSRPELGELLSVDRSTIWAIEKERLVPSAALMDLFIKTVKPSTEQERQLREATHFAGTDEHGRALYELSKTPPHELSTPAIRVPVLRDCSAGEPQMQFDDIPESLIEEYILVVDDDISRHEKVVAVRVVGDSMAPRLLEGDRAVIYGDEAPVEGAPALVCIEGAAGRETLVKTWHRQGDRVRLTPENPAYKERTYDARQIAWAHPVAAVWRRIT